MKWPKSLTLIRHGESAYNVLRAKKEQDPEYQLFKAQYEAGDASQETIDLAKVIKAKYSLGVGDYNTPLTEEGKRQARITGHTLEKSDTPPPDVIIYSPYLRTRETLEELSIGWKALHLVPRVEDDRIREQEHGLSILYNDWRVFHIFHPEQRELYSLQGDYWYQYPQGESMSQVRDRVRSMYATLIREYSEKHVLMITHHLTILSIRATLERLTPEQFLDLDENNKPVNCGITEYVGMPNQGRDGKLRLVRYNSKLY